MKTIIQALFASIPDLINVLILLIFIFIIFGILGIQFMKGASHYRCRLTPYPVAVNETIYNMYTDLEMDWYIADKPTDSVVYDIIYNRDEFPFCHYDDNVSAVIPLDDKSWNHKTSPWNTRIINFIN